MKKTMTFHRKKIWMVFLICIMLLLGLVGRLWYLMNVRAEYYSKKAEDLHERERDIKAARGKILDIRGNILADNRTVCTVSVIHSQIKDPEKVIRVLSGALSVKDTQTIDLVIRLEDWDKDKEYDRLGLEENYTEYLGNKVVCHNIPIRPGRNLAVICETAAINHRQKKMGYNAAKELYTRVQNSLAKRREEDEDDE